MNFRVLLAPLVAVIGASPLFAAVSDYAEVSCTSQAFFTANSCNQCFDGKGIKEKERAGGGNMYDVFANPNAAGGAQYVLYEDEHIQSVAGISIVNLGGAGTQWSSTGAEWKISKEIMFVTDSGGTNPNRKVYFVAPGQKVKVTESVLGAGYQLISSDKVNGDYVGMVKFPVAYHEVVGGTEGAKKTHYECVAYKLDGKVAGSTSTGVTTTGTTVKPAGTTTTTKPTTPIKPNANMTKTQTGPESLLLIAAAFFISFGLMFSLRRRA